MRRPVILAVALAMGAATAQAQSEADLRARDLRIKELLGSKDYPQTISEINAMVASAAGTTWQDSLWNYIYPLGNAHWKLNGPEAAAASAEDLYKRIVAAKRAPEWEVRALIKLNALYYDISLMEEYDRVGQLVLATAEHNASRIPPLVLADAHYCMALTHMDLGRNLEALPLVQRAVAIARDIDPLPITRLPVYFIGQGNLFRWLGRTREAEASLKEGIAVTERDTALAVLSTRAILLGNLAILIQGTGDLHRSKEVNARALQAMNAVIARTAGEPQEHTSARWNRTRIMVNLASTYFDMADFDRAGYYMREALAERTELLGDSHLSVIELNEGIAEVEAMAGNYTEAEVRLLELIRAVEASRAGGEEKLVDLKGRSARMAMKQGQLDRADSILSAAMPKDERTLTTSASRDLANALDVRADLRNAQGRHAEALRDQLLCRSIRGRAYGARNERIAESDVLISGSALAMGDTAMARQYADSALHLLDRRFAQLNGPFTPTALRHPGLVADAVMAKVAAARAVQPGLGDEREWLRQLEPAFTSLHRNMSSLSAEGARLQMAGSHRKLFDLGLDLAYAAHERFAEPIDLDQFVRIAEADRAILLKSRLNTFTSLRYANVPDSVLVREQGLLKALAKEPEARIGGNDPYADEQAYAAFLDTLQQRHPDYFALRYGEPQVTIRDLRKHVVTDRRDLLLYAVTGEHLYMLVVGLDTTALLRTSGKGVPEAVNALNAAVLARDANAYLKVAHDLYLLVFAPVAPMLRKTELFIIPDGELQRVNFEALLSKPSTPGNFKSNLLLQRHAIAYLLSATTAVQFDALKTGRSSKALAMAPGFTDELKQRYIAQVSDTAQIDRKYLGFVRQPFAMSTAQELGDLLAAKVMLGGEADERGFRSLAKEYGILHLGTHAELNEHAPLYSRLVLSKEGGSTESEADGYLHAYEIYEMELHAQLAVLTACETGAGSNTEGEGVRSLGYSFAYAGCPSLVTSLWSIDEKSSSGILTRFYEYLADGMPKHLALRQAKLDHLAAHEGELELPFYWAGLVMVGDVAPVELQRDMSVWIVLLAALAVVVLLLLVLRLRNR